MPGDKSESESEGTRKAPIILSGRQSLATGQARKARRGVQGLVKRKSDCPTDFPAKTATCLIPRTRKEEIRVCYWTPTRQTLIELGAQRVLHKH